MLRSPEELNSSDAIVIHGAREHNLKNLSLVIPRDKFVVITGVSGSGKSTLAFDLIFAEGQRRFLDSMNVYARQFVEQLAGPLADQLGEFVEVVRREHRHHGLALRHASRLVHGDETRPVVTVRDVADGDSAQPDIGGEDAVGGIDMHDVVVLGDRPIWLDRRIGAVVHRAFVAQPLEVGPQRVVAEQARRTGMEVLDRHRIGFFARSLLKRGLRGFDRAVDIHCLSILMVVAGYDVTRARSGNA